MRIVALSDMHGHLFPLKDIPDGDVLVLAGDISHASFPGGLNDAAQHYSRLMHRHKIVIPGNHDVILQSIDGSEIFAEFHYLIDEAVEIEGRKFYGSPFTPEFMGWAFMLEGKALWKKWQKIPSETEILITHGPPKGILDSNSEGFECGCQYLRERVEQIEPAHHIFGHIHEAAGFLKSERTCFHNVSITDEKNYPTGKPRVIDI